MNIAIIGAGAVGRALGPKFEGAGHLVTYGLRAPDDPKNADLANRDTVGNASQAADVIILAVPWIAIDDAIAAIAPATDKIVVDATNPLGMREGRLGLTLGYDTSGGEIVQQRLPEAKVVKTLNQIGAEFMADAGALDAAPVMFMASDSDTAKAAVAPLLAAIGFDAQDAGPLSNARLLEPLAMLWIWNAISGDLGRNFAFSIARRETR